MEVLILKQKIISWVIVFSLCVACLNCNAYAQNANDIVTYLTEIEGTSYTYGYCLGFVHKSFENVYGYRAYNCCAYKSGSIYVDSTSRDIPIGACVYFSGSKTTCETCWNKAGHVGIYIGNGNIMHNWDGKVTKSSIDYVVSRGYPYRGWGWLCDNPLDQYTEPPSYYVVCNTSEASSITATSAVFSGTFTNPASVKIIKRGYQWGTTPEMCNYTEFDCNITWDDGLSHNMTNLSPNTTYYYKLVVKCEDGSYIYGNTKTVTTLSMPDTEKPVISNLFARDISSKSFTIQCNLYDNSNIARVWFVVYSPDGEYQFGTGASNGIFSYKFDTENYGGAGIYSVHIYAFDENDNSSGMYSTGEFLVEDDNVSPTIENISVSNIGNKVFEIKCDLKDNVGIVRMWMVIYAPNGEHQFEIPASQGEFIYPINTELYGGIGEYVVHMYAFDAAENSSGMYSTGSIIPTYTIKYIVNTDSEDIETQLKKYDSNITLSSEIPTRTGYIFTEWNTKTDGSGVSYNPGATYTENNNLVLYAQWESVIPHTESTITKSGTKLIIDMNVHNINSPFDILIVGYKENRLVTMKRVLYNEQNSPYTLEGDIDEIKVMVWSDLSTLKPLCDAEVIQSNEFITE